ncbi:MAG: MazG family protein [Actinobacteria bacterium]|nr:MazG family protein [Actinomycetota bacterium]
MPLLVVPLALDEVELLTLGEWDRLLACSMVFFERPDHPLAGRLTRAGVPNGPFDDEPDAGDADIALVCDPSSGRVLELARAGASVTVGAATPPDDLSTAHAAPVLRRAAADLGTLVAVMARLRSDDGCPWDREQTHESLLIHLLEEAHEVVEAVEEGKTGTDLEEELGDILLQVAFHARLAEQDGRFDLSGVARVVSTKLVRRHPHVFGETLVEDSDEVVRNWEDIKKDEKERGDTFDGIPRSLPALLAAYKTQKRAASLGFSPDEARCNAELSAALEKADIGAALFWLVALARRRGVDPESALTGALATFRQGFSSRTAP